MVESAEDGSVPSSVGEQLAAERARQDLDLSDIAARTRIPLRHLEAIESGQHEGLPATPYSAGFVKSYANLLGLDGQAMSRSFRAQLGNEQRAHFEPEAYEPVDPSRVPTRLLAMVAVGVALLLGVIYLLLRFEGDSSDLARLAADTVDDDRPVAAARPSAPPTGAPAAQAVPTGPVTVAAASDVWLKISERDAARTYFMDILKAGASFTVPDDAIDPILRTGLPQAVKVSIGSTLLPPVGPADELVRAYSLKRDALVAIAMAPPATDAPALPGSADTGSGIVPATAGQPASVHPAAGADPAGSRPDTTEPAGQRP